MPRFKVIKANELTDDHLLRSMHRLRKRVFCDELRWSTGLNIVGDMEFDEYDKSGTIYIVRTDENDEVDATCRLIPTSQNYMIADHYPEFYDLAPLPSTNDIWEISRFCASESARRTSRGRVSAEIVVAAIEFGLLNGVKNYVALATDSIIPVIERIVGWDPRCMGDRLATPDDFSYAVKYSVSSEMLRTIKIKHKIAHTLISRLVKPYEIYTEKHQNIAA